MRIANKIWNSGWGAVFLTFYTAGALQLLFPQHQLYKLAAIVPTAIVMFVADYFSSDIIDFFAGGELLRSTEHIHQMTGGGHFFESASEEVQTRVDDFDRRAYQENISLLAGVAIATTSPAVGYIYSQLVGAAIGGLIAVLSIQFLSRSAVQTLNNLARDIREPYNAKYEN
ncbi:hypothetical protein [Halogranum rubrum]|uniref:hypothetical protein n=1 Tax=Halogranum rubrum TaxID=553466 RepID=UPI000677C542|nr:hypothetical protein [Halogranum salarium]